MMSTYQQRKAAHERYLTVYGRKSVLEALSQPTVRCARLHLSNTNRRAPILEQIVQRANEAHAEIRWHEPSELSRISRNAKQDQGVAADVIWAGYETLEDYLAKPIEAERGPLIALDRIHNPQNLGMLIRSVTAGRVNGILLPRRGCCEIDPLVVKASAGVLFRSRLIRCVTMEKGLRRCREYGWEICVLEASGELSLFDFQSVGPTVVVIGNESDGVSAEIRQLASRSLCIPLANGVESLNLAVAAALVAFNDQLKPKLK